MIVPVYNEVATVERLLRAVRAERTPKEIIVVDDASTDGTDRVLARVVPEIGATLLSHPENRGKGAALRTGLAAARGEAVVFQDADLEAPPSAYPRLLAALASGQAGAVFGSRFRGRRRWKGHPLARAANRVLTLLFNLLYGARISDLMTCHKMLRRDVYVRLAIRSDRFDVEAEVAAKIARQGSRIAEVPVTYRPRTFAQGKKIGARDFFRVVGALVRFRLTDATGAPPPDEAVA